MTSASSSLASLGSTAATARSGGGGNVAVMVTPDGAAMTSPDARRPATMGVRSHVGVSPSAIALDVAVPPSTVGGPPRGTRVSSSPLSGEGSCLRVEAGRLLGPRDARSPSGPMAPAVSSSITSRGYRADSSASDKLDRTSPCATMASAMSLDGVSGLRWEESMPPSVRSTVRGSLAAYANPATRLSCCTAAAVA